MREAIIAHGGEVHFNTKVTDLCIENGRIKALIVKEKREKGKREKEKSEDRNGCGRAGYWA